MEMISTSLFSFKTLNSVVGNKKIVHSVGGDMSPRDAGRQLKKGENI